ncbi:MAG: HAMP domain-containing protein [Gammaproteobacteria bacterium]|nr:HAMP domain-containing protein [Gammaproteobacteria bacterium]
MRLLPLISDWHRKRTGLISGDLLFPLIGIAAVFMALVSGSLLLMAHPGQSFVIIGLEFLLLAFGFCMIYISQRRIKQNLLEPLSQLRHWAHRMQGGNLSARIPVPQQGEFAKLAKDINDLGESLRSLSREMDDNVKRQTERLEQKTRTLEILYDVAANSNNTHDIEELLIRCLHTLNNILPVKAATARILTKDNQFRLVSSIGLTDIINEHERIVPVERCLCAQNFQQSVIRCQINRPLCGNLLSKSLQLAPETHIIVLPLHYQHRTLGIYHLFLPNKTIENETNNLLTNIAQHLSLAIEKNRLDDESKRITIMQERTMLAHELHDSLAQTLASLRFQISLLEKSIANNVTDAAQKEAAQLKAGLDEANNELRELLAHFRVHMDARGLIPATEALIKRFKNESGISVFFQNQCQDLNLPPIQEVQVLHIIQESLTNARKHSNAQQVRILIRQNNNTCYHVLVEDDGVGISHKTIDGQPGEHVGLSIMKERARRINGILSIESDPGEGTRIELDFCIDDDKTPLDNSSKPLALATKI